MKYRKTFREALSDVDKKDKSTTSHADTDSLVGDKGSIEDKLRDQIALLKTQLENERNKMISPIPNPETGEVPLRTGIANAILDKKIDTKKLIKSKKKDELAVGGKTKIEINPKADIGVFSGGNATNSGNLH